MTETVTHGAIILRMKIKDDRLIDCGYVEWKSTELLYVIDLQAIIIIECQILYRSTTKTTVERVNNETRDSLTSSSTEKEVD